MRLSIAYCAVALGLLPSAGLLAQARSQGNAEFIHTAEGAAPAKIASQASIARLDPSGKVTMLRKGSNDFTCTIMPDGSNAPYCGDKQGFPWMVAAMSHQPGPPATTQPGVGYMAKGGVHYEKASGEIVLAPSKETKEVKEPPHWMLLWPMDPKTSGIPTKPNAGGTYIMFPGTPYAHLMIYQDPNKLEK